MKILLFDTETNGLPKNRYAPYSCSDAFPAVLQLSWAMYTLDQTILTKVDSRDIKLRLDPGILWDTGAALIHGITEETARHKGDDPVKVFLDFRKILHSVDYIVCHNLAFDKPVVRAAAYAISAKMPEPDAGLLRNLWPRAKELCTMETTRNLVRIPSAPEATHKFKIPKLNELYTWLYGHVYDLSGTGQTLHSAKSDTHCLARCLTGLLRKRHLEVKGSLIVCTGSSE